MDVTWNEIVRTQGTPFGGVYTITKVVKPILRVTTSGTSANGLKYSVPDGCVGYLTETEWAFARKWISNCGTIKDASYTAVTGTITYDCGTAPPPPPPPIDPEIPEPQVHYRDASPGPTGPVDEYFGPVPAIEPTPTIYQYDLEGLDYANHPVRIVSNLNPGIIDPMDYRADAVVWVDPVTYQLLKESGSLGDNVVETSHGGGTTAAYFTGSPSDLAVVADAGIVLYERDDALTPIHHIVNDGIQEQETNGDVEVIQSPDASTDLPPYIPGGFIPD